MAETTTTAPFEEVLGRHTPEHWLTLGLAELSKARSAFDSRQTSAAGTALKRAAGMALNGALRVVPRKEWGRTYVEHLQAVSADDSVPVAVRAAAGVLVAFEPAGHGLAFLRPPSENERLMEAARTVMAHAYAVIHGNVGRVADREDEGSREP
ncbi:MAG: hypothetical protein QM784_01880 [Polyangiaceae bacterium]